MVRKCSKKVATWLMVFSLIGTIAEVGVGKPEITEAATVSKIKIGQIYSVEKKDATYASSDNSVAYVNSNGRVTGKKEGTAVITISSNGKTTKKTFQIVKNAKKPVIKVCPDEIQVVSVKVKEIGKEEIEQTQDQEALTQQDIENDTVTDDTVTTPEDNVVEPTPVIEKIIYTYKVDVKVKNLGNAKVNKVILKGNLGSKTLKLSIKKLDARKSAVLEKSIKITSKTPMQVPDLVLNKMECYASGMVSAVNYSTGKASYQYATKDKKAPVIRGFIGKNSYNGNVPYLTVYKDQMKTFDYFKYVSAEDDRDTKVKLAVDTSKVNFDQKGTYTITYIATDKAGNKAKAKAKIAVRVNDTLDQIADTVLGRITRKDWSEQKKATAIYNYTRSHIAYTGNSDKSSWENEAARGLRYGQGDCFTYYCVARALLTRAGLPNIEVTRVQGHGHHWWNMVYIQSQQGFYHFDACPRRAGGRFCLVTDAQLKHYSATVGNNSHIWAYSQKPKSATKVLTSIL